MSTKKKNIQSIYIAKGIGISLVVISHYAPTAEPAYWIDLRVFLYTFHVPAFFMMSGYLLGHRDPQIETLQEYFHLIGKKVRRLLVPFLTISILFFIIKYVAGKLFALQHPFTLKSMMNIIINPTESYKPILWYLFTLFLMFIIFTPLLNLIKSDIGLLLLACILMFVPWTKYFCLEKLFLNFPPFHHRLLFAVKNPNG